MLLSTAQGSDETETIFGKTQRSCSSLQFRDSQASADPEAELIRLLVLTGLKDKKEKRNVFSRTTIRRGFDSGRVSTNTPK